MRIFVYQLSQPGLRRAQGAGGLASPQQLRLCRITRHRQPVCARCLRVVTVAVRRQPDGTPALLPRHSGDAENKLAGTGSQHHAPNIHGVKVRQPLAQGGVAGVRVVAGIGVADSGQRSRARAARIAVG